MAKRLQLRRGTTAENDAFTGAAGEMSVDTERWHLRLHDGTSVGGHEYVGIMGASGIQGFIGSTGASGIQGFIGATGASGIQGFIGATGASGVTGFAGATGASGIQGFIGATGASGVTGFAGATGASGVQGFIGATGASGIQGFIGATGASGVTGLSGSSGFTGATGPGVLSPFTSDGTNVTLSSGMLTVASISLGEVTVTGNYSVSSNVSVVCANAVAGAITISLPSAANSGRIIIVSKIDSSSNAVLLSAYPGDTIIGQPTFGPFSQQFSSYLFFPIGTGWGVL